MQPITKYPKIIFARKDDNTGCMYFRKREDKPFWQILTDYYNYKLFLVRKCSSG